MLAEEIKQKVESKIDKQKELFKRVESQIKSFANHSEYALISLPDINMWMYQLDIYDRLLNTDTTWELMDQVQKIKEFLETEGFKIELCWSLNCIALKVIWQ
jgi:hypothetical protein